MANTTPGAKLHVDKNGVRTIEGSGVRTSVWLLALAIALVGSALVVFIRPMLARAPVALPATELAVGAPASHAVAAPPKAPVRATPAAIEAPRWPEAGAASNPESPPPRRRPVAAAAAQPPALDDAPPESDASDAEAADQPTGIGVFPPPGTKPIKRGIVVPDGVELPPGYVRHYQTTDLGRQLPPILMFHPDYRPLDANGQPIPLPEDRIVPPEMAPPGMPTEMLQVPDEGAPPTGDAARSQRPPEP